MLKNVRDFIRFSTLCPHCITDDLVPTLTYLLLTQDVIFDFRVVKKRIGTRLASIIAAFCCGTAEGCRRFS